MMIANCIEYVKMMKYLNQLKRLCRLAFFYFYGIQRRLRNNSTKISQDRQMCQMRIYVVFKIIYEIYKCYVRFVIQHVLRNIVLQCRLRQQHYHISPFFRILPRPHKTFLPHSLLNGKLSTCVGCRTRLTLTGLALLAHTSPSIKQSQHAVQQNKMICKTLYNAQITRYTKRPDLIHYKIPTS